jgi:CRISPR-associated protein (TIGR03984 family)
MTNGTEEIVLRRSVGDGIAPGAILDTLQAAGLGAGIAYGMVMARTRFDLIRVDNGRMEAFDADATDLIAAAYEVRLFGQTTEAHWQRTGAETGRLVVSTVGGASSLPEFSKGPVIQRRYRFWGQVGEPTGRTGWCVMTTARIRDLPVPVGNVATKSHLALLAAEHVKCADHGNAVIVAERLVGIEPIGPQNRNQDPYREGDGDE